MDRVIHFYPNARVLIVKSFANDDLVSYDQLIQLDLTQIVSVRTMRTVRNQPGSFSMTLMDTNNQLLETDDPDADIPAMRAASNSQQTIDRAEINANTVGKAGTNYYEFESFDDWKSFENLVLEDVYTINTELAKPPRYVTFYHRNRNGGIDERWAIDNYNRLIKFLDTESSLAEKESGSIISCNVIGLGVKNFVLRKFKNEELITKFEPRLNHGRCKIAPMDRVVIFFSKRYVETDDGSFKIQQTPVGEMVRTFTGLISRVSVEYHENSAMISIDGEDVTKWMKLSVVNVNPGGLAAFKTNSNAQDRDARTGQDQFPTGTLPNTYSQRFAGFSPPDIIKILTLGTDGLDGSLKREAKTRGINEPGIGLYKLADHNKPVVWIYDIQTQQYIPDRNTKNKISTVDFRPILGTLFTKSSVHVIDITKFGLNAYKPYEINTTGWTNWQSEFRDRRELAYEIAREINFMFYADRNGELWFTPPRYNNSWILGAENPKVFVLDEQSILNYSLVESDESIVTNIVATTQGDLMTIPQESLVATGEYLASYQDDNLVMKYGVRFLLVHNPLIRDKSTAFLYFYAKNIMQQLNADRLQGSITVVGRPEIDEGYPVYVPFLNTIYFAETVEDQLDVNGQHTTTISLSHGRKPWDFLPEFLTFGNDLQGVFSDLTKAEIKKLQQSLQDPNKPKQDPNDANASRDKVK